MSKRFLVVSFFVCFFVLLLEPTVGSSFLSVLPRMFKNASLTSTVTLVLTSMASAGPGAFLLQTTAASQFLTSAFQFSIIYPPALKVSLASVFLALFPQKTDIFSLLNPVGTSRAPLSLDKLVFNFNEEVNFSEKKSSSSEERLFPHDSQFKNPYEISLSQSTQNEINGSLQQVFTPPPSTSFKRNSAPLLEASIDSDGYMNPSWGSRSPILGHNQSQPEIGTPEFSPRNLESLGINSEEMSINPSVVSPKLVSNPVPVIPPRAIENPIEPTAINPSLPNKSPEPVEEPKDEKVVIHQPTAEDQSATLDTPKPEGKATPPVTPKTEEKTAESHDDVTKTKGKSIPPVTPNVEGKTAEKPAHATEPEVKSTALDALKHEKKSTEIPVVVTNPAVKPTGPDAPKPADDLVTLASAKSGITEPTIEKTPKSTNEPKSTPLDSGKKSTPPVTPGTEKKTADIPAIATKPEEKPTPPATPETEKKQAEIPVVATKPEEKPTPPVTPKVGDELAKLLDTPKLEIKAVEMPVILNPGEKPTLPAPPKVEEKKAEKPVIAIKPKEEPTPPVTPGTEKKTAEIPAIAAKHEEKPTPPVTPKVGDETAKLLDTPKPEIKAVEVPVILNPIEKPTLPAPPKIEEKKAEKPAIATKPKEEPTPPATSGTEKKTAEKPVFATKPEEKPTPPATSGTEKKTAEIPVIATKPEEKPTPPATPKVGDEPAKLLNTPKPEIKAVEMPVILNPGEKPTPPATSGTEKKTAEIPVIATKPEEKPTLPVTPKVGDEPAKLDTPKPEIKVVEIPVILNPGEKPTPPDTPKEKTAETLVVVTKAEKEPTPPAPPKEKTAETLVVDEEKKTEITIAALKPDEKKTEIPDVALKTEEKKPETLVAVLNPEVESTGPDALKLEGESFTLASAKSGINEPTTEKTPKSTGEPKDTPLDSGEKPTLPDTPKIEEKEAADTLVIVLKSEKETTPPYTPKVGDKPDTLEAPKIEETPKILGVVKNDTIVPLTPKHEGEPKEMPLNPVEKPTSPATPKTEKKQPDIPVIAKTEDKPKEIPILPADTKPEDELIISDTEEELENPFLALSMTSMSIEEAVRMMERPITGEGFFPNPQVGMGSGGWIHDNLLTSSSEEGMDDSWLKGKDNKIPSFSYTSDYFQEEKEEVLPQLIEVINKGITLEVEDFSKRIELAKHSPARILPREHTTLTEFLNFISSGLHDAMEEMGVWVKELYTDLEELSQRFLASEAYMQVCERIDYLEEDDFENIYKIKLASDQLSKKEEIESKISNFVGHIYNLIKENIPELERKKEKLFTERDNVNKQIELGKGRLMYGSLRGLCDLGALEDNLLEVHEDIEKSSNQVSQIESRLKATADAVGKGLCQDFLNQLRTQNDPQEWPKLLITILKTNLRENLLDLFRFAVEDKKNEKVKNTSFTGEDKKKKKAKNAILTLQPVLPALQSAFSDILEKISSEKYIPIFQKHLPKDFDLTGDASNIATRLLAVLLSEGENKKFSEFNSYLTALWKDIITDLLDAYGQSIKYSEFQYTILSLFKQYNDLYKELDALNLKKKKLERAKIKAKSKQAEKDKCIEGIEQNEIKFNEVNNQYQKYEKFLLTFKELAMKRKNSDFDFVENSDFDFVPKQFIKDQENFDQLLRSLKSEKTKLSNIKEIEREVEMRTQIKDLMKITGTLFDEEFKEKFTKIHTSNPKIAQNVMGLILELQNLRDARGKMLNEHDFQSSLIEDDIRGIEERYLTLKVLNDLVIEEKSILEELVPEDKQAQNFYDMVKVVEDEILKPQGKLSLFASLYKLWKQKFSIDPSLEMKEEKVNTKMIPPHIHSSKVDEIYEN